MNAVGDVGITAGSGASAAVFGEVPLLAARPVLKPDVTLEFTADDAPALAPEVAPNLPLEDPGKDKAPDKGEAGLGLEVDGKLKMVRSPPGFLRGMSSSSPSKKWQITTRYLATKE